MTGKNPTQEEHRGRPSPCPVKPMPSTESPTREAYNSGLIDLIAIDRDARASQKRAEEAAAAERFKSSTPPPIVLAPYGGARASEDVDDFALAMQSPWQKMSRAKKVLAVAGALGLALGMLALATSGGDNTAKATAAKSEPMATAVAAPPPPPPPPAPAPTTEASVTKVAPAPMAAPPPAKGGAKAGPKKARGGGPKLVKVQSGGVS